ncbi:MAG: 4-alpha-glucanotransferase [Alphaproteobacteria bacterium]|nr:4-alpha-glucanotransferase [Alphaproteobacteria bacterium]
MVLEYAQTVDLLAEKAGILPEFEADGGVYPTSFETKKALLKALELPADTPAEAALSLKTLKEKPFKRALPPVMIVRREQKTAKIPVTVTAGTKEGILRYEIVLENGEKLTGQESIADLSVLETMTVGGRDYEQRKLKIAVPDQLGYHMIRISGGSVLKAGREMPFIVVPEKCYMPEMMRQGGKPWGFPVQLYALRSERNWGIGDFSDLKEMNAVAKAFGADIVGINPINVAFAANWETASPYYSSSRLFLNPLYIDVEAVAGAKTVLKKWRASADVKARLKRARESALVDYAAVGSLKMEALRLLFAAFKGDKDFDAFCAEGGKDLESAALYQVLSVFFANDRGRHASIEDLEQALNPIAVRQDLLLRRGTGFKSWGKAYASPDTEQSRRFADQNADEVRFYKFIFWIADRQFQAASQESQKQGLAVGLYQDLAVGVASESAETWGAQQLFATQLSIGSPPDMFNANGQEWGVAPMRPDVMRDEAYISYRRMLSANMKRAGAVRIDHVMGLVRLFCIPHKEKGAYIRYHVEDMIGIVALESHRNQCLVVGEDLGVVPGFFREMLEKAGILSFRVFRYEQMHDGRYKPLNVYPETALIAAGTHDMPTLAGYWMGADIETARKIGLMDEERCAYAKSLRRQDRLAVIESLAQTGRWFVDPSSFDAEINGQKLPDRFIEVLYSYLATAPCCLLLVQLEDLLEQKEQMNMPGTSDEYPNWRHKLPKTVSELYDCEEMKRLCAAIRQSRQ